MEYPEIRTKYLHALRVCVGTEDGKIVTDTELVVWYWLVLILVGLLFYAVNFWFYSPWFCLLFIGPTEICVQTMIFFLGFTFFACHLVHYVSNRIQMKSEEVVIPTW